MPSPLWTQRVHHVMDVVRDDPAGDHTVESLAAVVHSSAFHFHRIFRAVAGETVGNFVRRARLERAAYLMKARPSRTLSSVALEAGFSTSQDFSRAFRRAYGVAPSRWDRRSRLADPQGRADHRPDSPTVLPPQIVRRGPIRLATVRVPRAFQEGALATGFDRLSAALDALDLPWREAQVVGMSWDNYETTPMDRIHYDVGIAVPDTVSPTPDFGIRVLDEFDAVEIECGGPLQEIAEAWDYLYEHWFPASRYEPADLPAMKWFVPRAGEMRWDLWRVSCSIALRPARG